MSNILIASNHISNIGDAFYQLSIIADLKSAFRDCNIIPGEENSCHLDNFSFLYEHNVLDYSLFGEVDWYILSGPILNKSFGKRYISLFKKLKERKVKLVFISVGGLNYDSDEIQHCRHILQEYNPYILSTRDEDTYAAYKDLAIHAYNGICSAFYSSFQFSGYTTSELQEYVVYAFDQYLEPDLKSLSEVYLDHKSNVGSKFSRFDYLRDVFRKYPESIGGKKIIRLQHDIFGKKPPFFIYRRPNTFVSFNPYSYLNIIKNSSLVIGTRVHACVVAISYQVPTKFFLANCPRAKLFERLGITNILNYPIVIDKGRLQEEHEHFLNFLKSKNI